MRRSAPRALFVGLVVASALGGCRQDMHDQPVIEPFEASDFFADGRGNRMPVEGTVARGLLRDDEAYYTGLSGDQFLGELPVANSRELLERGHERFDIFCSPCHGRVGDGRGMIVRRGFKQPASFHEARLRDQPVGYYFDVMSRGFGEMSSYASMINPEDRWAITAYIRALQLSQNVVLANLDNEDRALVTAGIAERNSQTVTAAGEKAGSHD